MIKTFSERIVEIANEVYSDDPDVKIEVQYFKNGLSQVRVYVSPIHYFELDEVEGDDDLLEQTDGDTVSYFVYRNDFLCFVGTEMYSALFYEFVRKMFELTI